MGAGIAVEFKRRYPAMAAEHRRRCLAAPREFNPGDAFLWQEPDKPPVFNLATQEYYGRRGRARHEWVEQSLKAMRAAADEAGITSIAMPRLAAGLGGLQWEEVLQQIRSIFEGWPGQVIIYEQTSSETSRQRAL